MRESKEFRTLAAKSSPRRSSWSFVKFEDCKKGQTAAKTGCTPASGEGTKEESGEAGDTQSKLDKLEKETMDSMRDMPTDHPDFDKTAAKMQKIAEAKIVDKARSGETEEAKAMAEEAGLDYEEVLQDAEKAAKEGVDIMEDLLGFPKEDRAEIKSDKKKTRSAEEVVSEEIDEKVAQGSGPLEETVDVTSSGGAVVDNPASKPSARKFPDGSEQIDHEAYEGWTKTLPDEDLKAIIQDAAKAAKDMPEGSKAGYYLDEINYAAKELANRRRGK